MTLLNTYFTGAGIMARLTKFRQSLADAESVREHSQLFDIQNALGSVISSLIASALLLLFLCVLILPFLQYILSLGRGYEIGVLRALGMSKGRAWARLLIENILLTSFALILSLGAAFAFHKPLALSLLGISAESEQVLLETFGDVFGLNRQAVLYTFGAAVATTLISSAFSNVLISNSAPLKLIQKHK
jgi:ABC-type antimicrobial peptide transport system permease subunit